jgi:hypothetical protein
MKIFIIIILAITSKVYCIDTYLDNIALTNLQLQSIEIEKVEKFYENKKFDAAKEKAVEVLKLDPNNFRAK